MKTNALLAFFFFLVALFFSTRADYVRDSEGDLVVSGDTYYLSPQDVANAAIVGAAIQNPDGTCSFAVLDKALPDNGNATKVESIIPTKYITTDYPLLISFDPLPTNPCTQYPEWLVAEDQDFQQNAVMVGDAAEFTSPVSGRLFFKTDDSAKHLYHLVFCFGEAEYCGLVAVMLDSHGNRRLIVAAKTAQVNALVLKLSRESGDRVASHISMVV